jgi:hypothetical protein
MAFEITQDSLFHFLKEKNYAPSLDQDSGQVYVVMNFTKYDIPIFFGIRGEGRLLQTIAYLPFEVKTNTLAQVARLLHILNKKVDMPGFGMDESQKLLFYRCVVPCMNGQLNGKLLELYLGTSRVACETFINAIALVAMGSATVEDALKNKG